MIIKGYPIDFIVEVIRRGLLKYSKEEDEEFTDGVYTYTISGDTLVENYYNYNYRLSPEVRNFLNRHYGYFGRLRRLEDVGVKIAAWDKEGWFHTCYVIFRVFDLGVIKQAFGILQGSKTVIADILLERGIRASSEVEVAVWHCKDEHKVRTRNRVWNDLSRLKKGL